MTIRQAILKEKKKKTSADEKEYKKCENEKVKKIIREKNCQFVNDNYVTW